LHCRVRPSSAREIQRVGWKSDWKIMDFFENFVDIMLWTLWIFCFFAYIFVLFRIVTDIFRDRELSGFGKTAWFLFLLFFNFIGALTYIIARGKGMAMRDMEQAQAMHAAQVQYAKSLMSEANGTSGAASELKAAKELLDGGVISQAEFDAIKAKALA
jgi:Phospholipase_D-nuclease N-terminal/Short C-terminal domain